MKTSLSRTLAVAALIAAGALTLAACTHARTHPSEQPGVAAFNTVQVGPEVIGVRGSAARVDLNREMQPTETMEVLAEARDDTSEVVEVRLKFDDAPIEVMMTRIPFSGTWRAILSGRQLQLLAVSGRTVPVSARVVATNAAGQVTVSEDRLEFVISAPLAPSESPASSSAG